MVKRGGGRCCGLDMDAQPNCCRNPPLFAYLVSKRKNRSHSQSLSSIPFSLSSLFSSPSSRRRRCYGWLNSDEERLQVVVVLERQCSVVCTRG
jgi:hypothetical protein